MLRKYCFAVSNLDKAEVDNLIARFSASASLIQDDIGILNYRTAYEAGNETVFTFAKSKHACSISNYNYSDKKFKLLPLLYEILVNVQHHKQVTLTTDTVFFNRKTQHVLILPISETEQHITSDAELIYQATKVAVYAENQGDLNNIKPFNNFVARCLSTFESQRPQTIADCLRELKELLTVQESDVDPPMFEEEKTFKEDMKALFDKLKKIKKKIKVPQFKLEEPETRAQVNETFREEIFSHLPFPEESN